ncbi:MAG: HD domain-containing protein [Candidatus Aminicenantes bacterium]|nr:HD domain-containing protein [Candidatus Aminicenantes bacterium]
MRAAKLEYPVITLEGRALLPAGTRLTPMVLRELIASNRDKPYRKRPFLGHGTVRRDIDRLFREPPYASIFRSEERTFVLGLMSKMRFVAPLLEFIDYAKKRDAYTYRHILMVFALSTMLVRDLITKSEDWITEAMAGTLHDLGKICVPLPVLKKSNPISRTEKNILEHHALAGFVLVCYYLRDTGSVAARVAKGHHERRDGSGYPQGVLLRDRMVEIIAACDVYDALISSRPYRPTPYDNRTALEALTDMARDGKLGWKVVQALVAHNRKDRPPYRRCVVSTEKRGIPPADSLYGKLSDEAR